MDIFVPPVIIDSAAFFKNGVTAFNLLPKKKADRLVAELSRHQFTKAPLIKGEKKEVEQNFYERECFREESTLLAAVIAHLEMCLRGALLLGKREKFNRFLLHRYDPPQEVGISEHCDGTRFVGPIAILVLQDGGEFIVFDDTTGQSQQLTQVSGDVILMTNRVPHAVLRIDKTRMTFTSRIDVRPNDPL